jgi:molybdopterin-guanine dinucleotide biosynthesis protein A
MNDKRQIAAFILAGGESSRMGRSKASLELGGMPMLLRTARLVEAVAGAPTVIGNLNSGETLGLATISDDAAGMGPLGGIATALRASEAPWNLIVACDLPYLTAEWLEFLAQRGPKSHADAVVPMNTRGAEPLCAMYHKRCEEPIRAALARGVRKVTDGLQDVLVELIDPFEWKAFDSEGLLFKNMNSPEDYEEARRRFEQRSGGASKRDPSLRSG